MQRSEEEGEEKSGRRVEVKWKVEAAGLWWSCTGEPRAQTGGCKIADWRLDWVRKAGRVRRET